MDFLHTGNKYWVFKDTTLQPGYPHDLITLGSGIPPHGIDSAIWWEDVGKTYFFKGDRSVHLHMRKLLADVWPSRGC